MDQTDSGDNRSTEKSGGRCAGRNARLVKALRDRKVTEQGGCCFYCDKPFSDELYATLDELVPQSLGGRRVTNNTVAACCVCNAKRGVMDWKMFKALVIAKRRLNRRTYKITLPSNGDFSVDDQVEGSA